MNLSYTSFLHFMHQISYVFSLAKVLYPKNQLAPHATPKLEEHSLSSVLDCWFSIFTAAQHIWRTSASEIWGCAMQWGQGTSLTWGKFSTFKSLYLDLVWTVIETISIYLSSLCKIATIVTLYVINNLRNLFDIIDHVIELMQKQLLKLLTQTNYFMKNPICWTIMLCSPLKVKQRTSEPTNYFTIIVYSLIRRWTVPWCNSA